MTIKPISKKISELRFALFSPEQIKANLISEIFFLIGFVILFLFLREGSAVGNH